MKKRVRRHSNPANLREIPERPDWRQLFGREAPLELDIGFGGGLLLAERARQAPDVDLIGVDVRKGLFEQVRPRLDRDGLHNVHLIPCNINAALETLFIPEELARVYVMFPDPWFKKRHRKRRVITAPFVAALWHRMAPDAELHIATDQEALAHEMRDVVEGDGGFENANGPGAFAPGSTTGIVTETEAYYRRTNQPCWYLLYRRRPAAKLHAPAEQLCRDYLDGAEHLRRQVKEDLRVAFALSGEAMAPLVARTSAGDGQGLLLSVALVSLLDGYPDARDATLLLGDLVQSAEAHGLDWRAVFARVASVSNEEPGSWMGGESTRTMLLRWSSSG